MLNNYYYFNTKNKKFGSLLCYNYTKVSLLKASENHLKIICNSMYTTVGGVNRSVARNLFITTFNEYVNIFENLSLQELQQDKVLIATYAAKLANKDYLHNRAFQLAFEASYNNRKFSRAALSIFYDTKISVRNILDPEDRKSFLDQSTVFNIFQSLFLSEQFPNTEIVINQTPCQLINKNQLDNKTQASLNLNKSLTGNTFPDVCLNGNVYDFKNTKNPSHTLNHIYILVDSPKAHEDFIKHISELNKMLLKKQNTLPREFYTLYKIKLNDLIVTLQNKPSPEIIKEANKTWNKFLIEHPQRPINFTIPVYSITNNTLPVQNLDDFQIPIDEGHLDFVKTKKALAGILLNKPTDLNEKIYEATNGALGHILEAINNIEKKV